MELLAALAIAAPTIAVAYVVIYAIDKKWARK